ncbi:MAG: c-type cytochrome [Methylohalobius sp. ZOD2]|nr:cytochrome c [Methylothermaceae bacterium]
MSLRKLIFGAAMTITTLGMASTASALEFSNDELKWMGMKIYQRAAGRGCGTCHDVRPFPELDKSIQQLSKEEFLGVVKNGRKGTIMTPMAPQIMEIGLVESVCMTEEQALDALYMYLKGVADGEIKGKVKTPKSIRDKKKACGK